MRQVGIVNVKYAWRMKAYILDVTRQILYIYMNSL